MSRITILVHTYYPALNGVQAVTQYVAEGLAKRDNEVTVITALKGDSLPSETQGSLSFLCKVLSKILTN